MTYIARTRTVSSMEKLLEMLRSSDDVRERLHALGVDLSHDSLRSRGLVGMIAHLREKLTDAPELLVAVFGSQEIADVPGRI